jgi:amidase
MSSATELTHLTAAEAVDLLRAGKVSPLELVDAAIARIDSVDPAVNALPVRRFDQARETARRFPAKLRDSAGPGWLAGLPVAAKEFNDVAGLATTYGSPIFANNVAAKSDLSVTTLEQSGAIVIAKSNVPEFAGSNTFNSLFGATRNPWDLRMTAGGSSGGAAAALAAEMVWLAMGSDLGGSLRIPASYCGIVGMRPSVGRVARGVSLPAFDSLWVEGPMGRTVADVALMLDAQAGQSPHDSLSMPPPLAPFTESVRSPRPPRRIAFSPNLGLSRVVDPEVVEICRAATRRFENIGCEVEEAEPDFKCLIETFETLRAYLFATLRGELVEKEGHRILPSILSNIEKGLSLRVEELLRAERQRAALFHRVSNFFDTFDILACPCVATPPFKVEKPYPTEIGGEELTTYIDWMFLTFVVTLTGCPAISVPCGFTKDGLPVGLQLIGPSHGDFKLLSAAYLLEVETNISGRIPTALQGNIIRSQA